MPRANSSMPRPPTACSKGRADHITQTGYPACRGHKNAARGGACCTLPPMKGQNVCRSHGGAAGRSRAAGARRVATRAIARDAAALLAYEGITGVDDPIAMIGILAVEALALKRAAGARVNDLEDIRYTGGLERDERGELRGTGTEQTRAEVLLYERALDRSMKFIEIQAKHAVATDVDQTKSMLTKLGEQLGLDDD